METYFILIDPIRGNFPVTPAPSVPGTPFLSATPASTSRAPSPERSHHAGDASDGVVKENSDSASPISPMHHRTLHIPSHDRPSHRNLHRRSQGTYTPRFNVPRHLPHHTLHHKLLALSDSHKEKVVGVFESQRYLNLEATSHHDPDAKTYTTQTTALLGKR
jgi:hypothetical protein